MLKQFLFVFYFAAMSVAVIPAVDAAETVLAPQTVSERGVKVTVTPRNLSRESKIWDFEIALETHTQSLDVDLAKSSVLIADNKQYAPLKWDGAPPGGHHRRGSLRFKALTPQPTLVKLQIHLTGEDVPRSFQWNLKGVSNGN